MIIHLSPDQTKVFAGLERFRNSAPMFLIWEPWPIKDSARVIIWQTMEAYNQEVADIKVLLGKDLEGKPHELT